MLRLATRGLIDDVPVSAVGEQTSDSETGKCAIDTQENVSRR